MIEIIMRRHAQTEGNINHRYNGSIDEHLCEEGIKCAKSFEPDYDLDEIYVTPLKRTQETAKILYPNAKQIICDGLREMDFGDFEGRNHIDMANDAEYSAWLDSNCESKCPNGEKKSDFVARCIKEFRNIVQLDSENNVQKRVFLVHGGVIMAIFGAFSVPNRDYFTFETENCGGYRAEFDDEVFKASGEIILKNYEKIGTGEIPKWN